jgi:tRNA A37 threonylcarbamoyladenosine synthetase subunit TsaC/SUA5/YrdC
MSVLNPKEDASSAFKVINTGGIGILPMDVGYSMIGGSLSSLIKIFDTKKRSNIKLNAMLGNNDLHKALHLVSSRGQEIVEAICDDYDLPLGLVAPCDPNHELFSSIEDETYSRSTKNDTLLMLMNSGSFHAEITDLSFKNKKLLFGSSANLSTTGTRFCVEAMQPEITSLADIIIDYGLVKYHSYGQSSSLLNVETLEVYRYGVAYENIVDILKRHFKIDLPVRPVGDAGKS